MDVRSYDLLYSEWGVAPLYLDVPLRRSQRSISAFVASKRKEIREAPGMIFCAPFRALRRLAVHLIDLSELSVQPNDGRGGPAQGKGDDDNADQGRVSVKLPATNGVVQNRQHGDDDCDCY